MVTPSRWKCLSVSIFTFLLLQAILGSISSEALSFNGGDKGITILKKVVLPTIYALGIILGLYALEKMKTDNDSKWFWLLVSTPFALFLLELSATIGSFDEAEFVDREDIRNFCTLMKIFNVALIPLVADKDIATCKAALAFGFMALFLLFFQLCLAYALWQSQIQFHSPIKKSVTVKGAVKDALTYFHTRTAGETIWIVWDVANVALLLLQAILGIISLRTFYLNFIGGRGDVAWIKFSLPLFYVVGNILGGYALEKIKVENSYKWLSMLLIGPLAIFVAEIASIVGSLNGQSGKINDIENHCETLDFLVSFSVFPKKDVVICRISLGIAFFALFSLFFQLAFGIVLWHKLIKHKVGEVSEKSNAAAIRVW